MSTPPRAAPAKESTRSESTSIDLPSELAGLETAMRKAEAGLFEQALVDLDGLVDSATPEVARQALLSRAEVQQQAGQPDDAMVSLIEFGARFPDASEADDAQFRLAEVLRSLGESRRGAARDAYSRLIESYPSSPHVLDALVHRAGIERQMKLMIVDPVLGRQVPASLVSLRTLVERFPTDRAAEDGGWKLAETYRELGLLAEAAAAYAQVGESFPQTRYDAWWEAGQLLEDKLSDKPGALAAYRRVPESSRNHGKARRKVRRLSK